jgi:hypothetical protein
VYSRFSPLPPAFLPAGGGVRSGCTQAKRNKLEILGGLMKSMQLLNYREVPVIILNNIKLTPDRNVDPTMFERLDLNIMVDALHHGERKTIAHYKWIDRKCQFLFQNTYLVQQRNQFI